MIKQFRRHFKEFKRSIRHRRKILDEAQAIAKAAAAHKGPKIFIDCGFNQGKVMGLFAGALPDFTFYGFEANTSFRPQAERLKRQYRNVRDLSFAAVSDRDGEAPFWLAGALNGAHIQEGSTLVRGKDEHQTDFEGEAQMVKTIDFSNWLKNLAAQDQRPFIALKMDIEGSEYDVLEDMFARGAIDPLNYLMIEFHSYCFTGDQKSVYENREKSLMGKLHEQPLILSQWF